VVKAYDLSKRVQGRQYFRLKVDRAWSIVAVERDVTRLGLYKRQINAQFKSTYSLLERARAYRLGMPVPPPVSIDLTVTKGHDANGV
jgi:hypothetical protein